MSAVAGAKGAKAEEARLAGGKGFGVDQRKGSPRETLKIAGRPLAP